MLKFLSLISMSVFSFSAAAEVTWRLNNDVYGSTTYRKLTDSPVNPSNRVLEVPESFSSLEYRPDLLVQSGDDLRLVIRSRWMLEYSRFRYENPDDSRSLTKGRVDLSDAFVESSLSENSTAAVGLQNYQWGPAELYSPSNPFFHFKTEQKSFFYKEKGRVLARLNLNSDSGLNVVAIHEPISNNESNWVEDRPFTPKSLVKLEYQFENRSNYFSVLAGSGEMSRPFVGEYFNWSPVEGVSLYVDARHDQGRTNYIPVRNQLGSEELIEAEADERMWQTLALLGFRYEEGDYDFRQEYLYNSAGLNEDEWTLARSAVTTLSPAIVQNLKRLAKPGLEFLSQHYSYTSIRIPDLGRRKDSNFYLRYLSNIIDHSGVVQIDLDKNWNESVVVYLEGLIFHGSKGTEFRLSDDFQTSVGFRKSF